MCMGLTPDDLQELLAAFEQSSWQEMTVSVAGDTLHVEDVRELLGDSSGRFCAERAVGELNQRGFVLG